MPGLQTWAIQSSGLIKQDEDRRLIEALESTSIEHVTFGVVPFTNEITGWQEFPNEPMFVHCSTKALKILTNSSLKATEIFIGAEPELAERIRQNLLAGVFYDESKFDQAAYLKNPIRENLLNGNARVVKIKDWLHEEFPREYFVKPTKDLKSFKGGVIQAGQTLTQFVHSGIVDASFSKAAKAGETMLIAPVQTVLREYRFFVLDGVVITGSMYMLNGAVQYSELVPAWLVLSANRLASLYQPARAFTLDLGLVEGQDDPKIVEYNCLNCSGLYHADIAELARSLQRLELT